MTDKPGSGENTASPAEHSDSPPNREQKSTGVGSEANPHQNEESHQNEHRSGYGGKGGAPDTSSDKR